jgi:large subunit ribosomal protein L2
MKTFLLKTYKPITPSLRSRRILNKKILGKNQPIKCLTRGLIKTGGRNQQGRITVRHRGGGTKKRYRMITFHALDKIVPAKVLRIEYDPNRSAFIALLRSLNTNSYSYIYSYILAPEGLKTGALITSSSTVLASNLPLTEFPLGSVVHNISGKYCRSAGTYATLLSLNNGVATLALPSKQILSISSKASASLGKVSNPEHNKTIIGKAGGSRWLGYRPTVRGEAMNPVDHPHGGKTKGGRIPRSPWGKIQKKTKKKR